MNLLLIGIEIVAVLAALVYGVLWALEPDGSFEPRAFLALILLPVIEIIRRFLGKNTTRSLGPHDARWWKQRQGICLDQGSIPTALTAVLRASGLRHKVWFVVEKGNGEQFTGRLSSIASGAGYVYNFESKEGIFKSAHLDDISAITVLNVDE